MKNIQPRWLVLKAVLLVSLNISGCAVYTAASLSTYAITDKTISDHAITAVTPNADCSTTNPLNGKYYCEVRDIGTTYNRNPF